MCLSSEIDVEKNDRYSSGRYYNSPVCAPHVCCIHLIHKTERRTHTHIRTEGRSHSHLVCIKKKIKKKTRLINVKVSPLLASLWVDNDDVDVEAQRREAFALRAASNSQALMCR